MTKTIVLMIAWITLVLSAGAVTIYDVQFASSRGIDGSYPSSYLGKTVTLDGVVTAAGYRNGGFFISELTSGAWRGILVETDEYHPASGTYLRITGKVAEVFGMTCLQDISYYRVLDYNRPLPKPVIISSGQIASSLEAEAYEGVYCRIINPSTSSSKSKSGRFMVNDGSGQCVVSTSSLTGASGITTALGTQYAHITGIVMFGYGEYSLNPIGSSDAQVQQPVSTQNRSWGKIKSIYK